MDLTSLRTDEIGADRMAPFRATSRKDGATGFFQGDWSVSNCPWWWSWKCETAPVIKHATATARPGSVLETGMRLQFLPIWKRGKGQGDTRRGRFISGLKRRTIRGNKKNPVPGFRCRSGLFDHGEAARNFFRVFLARMGSNGEDAGADRAAGDGHPDRLGHLPISVPSRP